MARTLTPGTPSLRSTTPRKRSARSSELTPLGYLSVENVQKLAEHGGGFCTACFSGCYPTQVPENTRKLRFERKLSEKEPKA